MVIQSRILVLLLVVIGMAACSGDDTGIEVILEPEIEVTPEPEPVEEVIPEPVVEIVYVPTLESWGIEDGELEIVNGNCNLPIFRKVAFPHDTLPALEVATWGSTLTTEWKQIGGPPNCATDNFYTDYSGRKMIDLTMSYVAYDDGRLKDFSSSASSYSQIWCIGA